MRFKISSVVSLVILLALSTAQGASVVSQFVVGGGYEFVIILANKSSSSHSIEFELLEGYDQPWSVSFRVNGQPRTGNIVSIRLAGHSVEKLRLSGGNSPHVGYLRVTEDLTYEGFVSPFAVQFFCEFRQGGEVIDSIGAPEGRATFGSKTLAFPVERSHTVNTGFALAHWSLPGLSSGHFSYTLRLFDHLCVTVLRQELTSTGFQLTNVPPDFGLQLLFSWTAPEVVR